jgi:hypothetical protein
MLKFLVVVKSNDIHSKYCNLSMAARYMGVSANINIEEQNITQHLRTSGNILHKHFYIYSL